MTVTFETDTVIITVPITREADGAPLDISGATLEAVAQRRGRPAIEADVAILDGPGGVCRVSWAAESFAAAVYDWQLRVTIGAEVQTVVSETIVARRSIRVVN